MGKKKRSHVGRMPGDGRREGFLTGIRQALEFVVWGAGDPDRESGCVFCGGKLPVGKEFSVCDLCRRRLTLITGPRCASCGRKLQSCSRAGGGTPVCSECRINPPVLDRVLAVGEYSGLLRDLLYELKYGGRQKLAIPLGRLLAEAYFRVTGLGEKDRVTPVPIHFQRRKQRGFNQSLLLARQVARELDTECRICLERNVATQPQSRLNRRRRIRNVRNTMVYTGREEGTGGITVVDDIMATGATLNEAARTLKESGFERVTGLVLARGGG